ncbi:MAG TPA: PEP-CTERM sorting domain-containing protein [Myxococcota bacterium]|nr:PEP-CTERM sorting domain-containing protein [Myxococcota bacterium]
MRRIRLFSALALVVAVGWAGTAGALQLVPAATARLHTITSGQPGAQWNTTGGAQLSYDATSEIATLTANLDVLNWFDTGNISCPTDAGSNCSHNYTTDLAITIDASYAGGSVTALGGGFFNVRLDFETTANAAPDLTVLDPTDVGFGNVLEGDWQAGLFNGNPTTGLSFTAVFNANTNTVVTGSVNGSGFLAIDSSTAYAGLFESGSNYFGLQFATLSNFGGPAGNLDGLIGYAVANGGDLPDFTAEANGQVYRVTSGEFEVPEPGSTALIAGGLALLIARRRAR